MIYQPGRREEPGMFVPFRNVLDDFQKKLGTYYIPGPLLTIDEQMVPLRRRYIFLQYIQSKPDRYGIKVFWNVDAENGFPLFGIPYLGRPPGPSKTSELGAQHCLAACTTFLQDWQELDS